MGIDEGLDLAILDESILISGRNQENDQNDLFLLTYNPSDSPAWNIGTYVTSEGEKGIAVAAHDSESVYVAGYTLGGDDNPDEQDILLTKFNEKGIIHE